MSNKALLMILDGWGIGDKSKADAIYNTPTPCFDKLVKENPTSKLYTSGEDVGLPDGQMGNSEVGHLNIGAGRIVYQDLVKINKDIEHNTFKDNARINEAFTYAKENGKKVHLLGLVSNGGVHSSNKHIYELCRVSKEVFGHEDIFVHAFMDGRDTDPKSGLGFLKELQEQQAKTTGKIASVIGRYYAMDRDKRWDRVKMAYDVMVKAEGKKTSDILKAVEASYANDVTDEFIKPLVNTDENGNPIAKIEKDDVVIFFNYRNDRARELTVVLTQEDMPNEGMNTIPLKYYTMTPYDATFKGVSIVYDKENVVDTIGEVVAKAGRKQIRIAETEKYAHVTFFFSGGREAEFENEERILVNSPKVATYDLQPEMSAFEVKDKLIAKINDNAADFIALNFANADMVGHTGVYSAIEKAVGAVDTCVGEVVEAAKANDYQVIIIADHGNSDNAINTDGSVNTAHSLNPVPCVVVSDKVSEVKDGVLADVAPSLLKLMEIEQPELMTGKTLF